MNIGRNEEATKLKEALGNLEEALGTVRGDLQANSDIDDSIKNRSLGKLDQLAARVQGLMSAIAGNAIDLNGDVVGFEKSIENIREFIKLEGIVDQSGYTSITTVLDDVQTAINRMIADNADKIANDNKLTSLKSPKEFDSFFDVLNVTRRTYGGCDLGYEETVKKCCNDLSGLMKSADLDTGVMVLKRLQKDAGEYNAKIKQSPFMLKQSSLAKVYSSLIQVAKDELSGQLLKNGTVDNVDVALNEKLGVANAYGAQSSKPAANEQGRPDNKDARPGR